MLGKIESRKRRGQKRVRWLDGIMDSTDMSLSKLWEMIKDSKVLQFMGSKRVGHDWVTEQQQPLFSQLPLHFKWRKCCPGRLGILPRSYSQLIQESSTLEFMLFNPHARQDPPRERSSLWFLLTAGIFSVWHLSELAYLILRAQQTVHKIIKGIMGVFSSKYFIFFFFLVMVHKWGAFNPYHRYPELGTSLDVITAKSPIFLMIKLSAREEGSELFKTAHWIRVRTRTDFTPPDSSPTAHCFAPSYALCISKRWHR